MANKPLVIAAIGSRGSGKSAWVKQLLGEVNPPRLVIWDYMHEYAATAKAVTEMPALFRAMAAPTWRLAYQVKHGNEEQDFDRMCQAIKLAKKCVFVAEELAFVTKPNKAPPIWRELCLLGRHTTHAESTLIGISQRPASIDKDFLACADVIHCGRLLYEPDAKAVAPFLGCDWRELTQLPDLHFLERTQGGEIVRGQLSFAKKVAKKVAKKPTPKTPP